MTTVSIDLNSHVAHDRSLMAFQCLQGNFPNVFLAFAEKLLTCRLQHLHILTLNFDLTQKQKMSHDYTEMQFTSSTAISKLLVLMCH